MLDRGSASGNIAPRCAVGSTARHPSTAGSAAREGLEDKPGGSAEAARSLRHASTHMHEIRRTEPRTITAKADGPQGLVAGYGSTFGNVDRQSEAMAPGCFAASLKSLRDRGGRLPMLAAHDVRRPIGAWHSLAEDERGLFVEGKCALGTDAGREAFELARLGAYGLSIGFRGKQHAIARDGVVVWREVELLEVSLVAVPANEQARLTAAKSLDGCESLAELEDVLRDALRVSRRRAKHLASVVWPHLDTGPLDTDDCGTESIALKALVERVQRATANIRGTSQ